MRAIIEIFLEIIADLKYTNTIQSFEIRQLKDKYEQKNT